MVERCSAKLQMEQKILGAGMWEAEPMQMQESLG